MTTAHHLTFSPPVPTTILIVDDDRAFRSVLSTILTDAGYTVALAASGREAQDHLGARHFDLVLTDLVMDDISGIHLLQYIKANYPDTIVFMVTGFASINTAVEAMRLGAYDYLTKPSNNDELMIKIRRAVEDRWKTQQLVQLRSEVESIYSLDNIISRSEKMKDVFKQIRRVADTDATVLIQGETGTGKELVAKAIHYHSARKDKPLNIVDCSAVPETLMESELFGHEKGSFTGALKQRIGKFEEAHGGTVFLDEISDIPINLQIKLLRTLQEKTIQRVGSNDTISVDVRIIAATNRPIDMLVAENSFREDLYYRLNVFPIFLPPLRERIDDVPLLADHFLKKYAQLSSRPIYSIAPSAMAQLVSNSWRGNVRELENIIKRAIIQCEGVTITSFDIPTLAPPAGISGDQSSREPAEMLTIRTPYKEYLRSIIMNAEAKYLVQMLSLWKGNINKVAHLMGLDRKTIYKKMADNNIDVDKFRS
ncbi:MAG: sigma-54 dependent transcriptional regulator [Bacteroidota bacterium]